MDIYQVCSNFDPWANNGRAPGVTMFYIGFIGKNMKKSSFSETIMSRAVIFGMLHDLVDLYQVCSNYAPAGAKIGPT